MRRGRIFLGGGGSGADEGRLWAEMLTVRQRILYWPFALDGEMLRGAEGWLRQQFDHHAVRPELVTWSTLDGRDPRELQGFDLLIVGGGNTFKLLDHVRRHGFVEPVRRYVRDGGTYYGGSAGAILATGSIAIAGTLDPNDIGLTDLSGLDLVPGHALLPHYEPDQASPATTWSLDHGVRVLCVPERAGVVADDRGALRAVGPATVLVADGRELTPLNDHSGL